MRSPWPQVLLVPLWVAAAAFLAFGVGTRLSAINVRYRDVRHALPFLLQTWFFLSPMVFPSSLVGEDWRAVYALNPLVGLVDGLRWSLWATRHRRSRIARWRAASQSW